MQSTKQSNGNTANSKTCIDVCEAINTVQYLLQQLKTNKQFFNVTDAQLKKISEKVMLFNFKLSENLNLEYSVIR